MRLGSKTWSSCTRTSGAAAGGVVWARATAPVRPAARMAAKAMEHRAEAGRGNMRKLYQLAACVGKAAIAETAITMEERRKLTKEQDTWRNAHSASSSRTR